jgi:hypothetical protein
MNQQQVQYPPVEVFLCSRSAINTNNEYYNDCTWQLPRSIIAPNGYALYVQLIDMTIPVSWHVVNFYNNQLLINGVEYILTQGNYSVRTLVTALNTLIPDVTTTFNDITLKVTLSSTEPFTVSGTLCNVLGIVSTDTAGTDSANASTSISSRHTVDMTSQNSIYILSDFTSSNSNIDTNQSGSSVFCRIPVDCAPMQVLQHEDYNGKSGLLCDGDISSVHLKLLDEDFNPLLNTLHWQATLQVSFLYTGRLQLVVDKPLGLRAADAIL